MRPLNSPAKTGVGKFASDDCAHSGAEAASESRNAATAGNNLRNFGRELRSITTSPARVPSLSAGARLNKRKCLEPKSVNRDKNESSCHGSRFSVQGLCGSDAEGGTR